LFALVDCQSCFASCEQIYRPDLRGRPVVVLSNNDGCVVARSPEAKALGIPDLIPYFKIRADLEQHNVAVFSSNYELYGDTSARLMSLLRSFCNELEVYSIDEAFLDLTGFRDLMHHGHRIKTECFRQQRMNVRVGIGPTKTLAKLAQHIAKKSRRLDGVCVIDDIPPWGNVFGKIPVSDIWGIGKRLSTRLNAAGIKTVLDFAQAREWKLDGFNVDVRRTQKELNGTLCLTLETTPPPKKQIISSRSFGQKVSELELLLEAVASHAAIVGHKLRSQKSLTGALSITIMTSRFENEGYFNSLTVQLPYPTNDTRVLIREAKQAASTIYRNGYRYTKAAVMALDLIEGDGWQYDLFSQGRSEIDHRLMAINDELNRRFGRGTIQTAAEGIHRPWAMSRKLKSPSYTTSISAIPICRL
jgi:DNA polymerase V